MIIYLCDTLCMIKNDSDRIFRFLNLSRLHPNPVKQSALSAQLQVLSPHSDKSPRGRNPSSHSDKILVTSVFFRAYSNKLNRPLVFWLFSTKPVIFIHFDIFIWKHLPLGAWACTWHSFEKTAAGLNGSKIMNSTRDEAQIITRPNRSRYFSQAVGMGVKWYSWVNAFLKFSSENKNIKTTIDSMFSLAFEKSFGPVHSQFREWLKLVVKIIKRLKIRNKTK